MSLILERKNVLVLMLLMFALFRANATTAENVESDGLESIPCAGVYIGPSGMAWSVGKQGQLVTGLVVCKYETYEMRTLYLEGHKHGIEQLIELEGDQRIITRRFRRGELLEVCRERVVTNMHLPSRRTTFCLNAKTHERYIKKPSEATHLDP